MKKTLVELVSEADVARVAGILGPSSAAAQALAEIEARRDAGEDLVLVGTNRMTTLLIVPRADLVSTDPPPVISPSPIPKGGMVTAAISRTNPMPVKMTGAQYKAFVAAPWDENCDLYMDDTVFLVNGEPFDEETGDFELCIADTDVITIVEGALYKNSDDRYRADLVAYARKWLKGQATTTLLVHVDVDQVEAFKAMIADRFPKAKIAI